MNLGLKANTALILLLLTGNLPSFGECKQLKGLDCSSNKFSGIRFLLVVCPVIQIGVLESHLFALKLGLGTDSVFDCRGTPKFQ